MLKEHQQSQWSSKIAKQNKTLFRTDCIGKERNVKTFKVFLSETDDQIY